MINRRAILAGLFLAARTAGAQHEPHWSYEGPNGPDKWATLSPAFASCALGQRQSPIDISGTTPLASGMITIAYASTALKIVNNGHTVQVDHGPGSSIEVGGDRYDLLQFHFHSPSEHSVAGKREAMEIHFVHRNPAGRLAVIGVLLREGARNSAYESILRSLPDSTGEFTAVASEKIDTDRLLPAKRNYWTYEGSLTTPPCSEGVTWIVLGETVELSREQIDRVTSVIHNNARPIQPIGTRSR